MRAGCRWVWSTSFCRPLRLGLWGVILLSVQAFQCVSLRAGAIATCSIAVGTQPSNGCNNPGTPSAPSGAFAIAGASSSMLIAEAGIGAIPPPLLLVLATADANYQGFLSASGGTGGGFVNVFFFTALLTIAFDPETGEQTHFDVTLGTTTQHYAATDGIGALPPVGPFEVSAPFTFGSPIPFNM